MILISRRDLARFAGAIAACAAVPTMGMDRDAAVESIERTVVREGRNGGTTWFHPRPCLIPGPPPLVLMTLQPISGSDVYGPVHWSESLDGGARWSDPQPIPGLGRRNAEGGLEEGVCDVVPEYHPATGSVLAIGHNVFYRRNVLARPQLPRHPVYAVRNREGQWSSPQVLAWDDPRGAVIFTCGCGQRVTLSGGDILIPLSLGPAGREDRSVATARCSFDGLRLTIRSMGNELRHPVKRGLLEPSMSVLDGRYYMTIRAEDDRGYVTASDDGMNWTPPVPWAWDDGSPLTMSTTQQHWLTRPDSLYLVYTRKDPANAKVFRWRTPLYMAEVDRKTLRLARDTEQIVLPMRYEGNDLTRVAKMGNFHVANVGDRQSLVMVGEEFAENAYRGDLLMARIRWRKP